MAEAHRSQPEEVVRGWDEEYRAQKARTMGSEEEPVVVRGWDEKYRRLKADTILEMREAVKREEGTRSEDEEE